MVDKMIFLEKIFFVGIFLFMGFYIIYYTICFYYKKVYPKQIKKKPFNDINLPSVTFLIPVYNESKVIKNKFKNINELDYPFEKLEIVFIDGGSNDGSLDLIKENIDKYKYKSILVEQGKRLGFNKAVIDGFNISSGEIIFIPGAETVYKPDTLKKILPYYNNKNVGAVNGVQRILNPNKLSPKQEISYRNLQNIVKEGENSMHSIFIVQGEIVSGRRFIVKKLIENPIFETKGCIDCNFFFQSIREGYDTVFDADIAFYENSPESFYGGLKQLFRRAGTLIENTLINKDMILNSQYGLFGKVIMPANFMMLMILPFLFVLDFLLLLSINLLFWPNYLYLMLLMIGLTLSLFSIPIQTFIKLQIILFSATIKILTSGMNTQTFERIDSTRG